MQLLKGFIRDPITNAVINKDDRDYKDHTFKMNVFKEINELKTEIRVLREELKQTKALIINSEEKN
jgi:single-stranded DNA-specific DHH superfamily exonuclease